MAKEKFFSKTSQRGRNKNKVKSPRKPRARKKPTADTLQEPLIANSIISKAAKPPKQRPKRRSPKLHRV